LKGVFGTLITTDINKVQKNKTRIHLPNISTESTLLGILLALVGGFLDAYTFIGRGGVFANAQTGNIVLVGINAFERNWHETIIHILPIIAFTVGVIAYQIIKNTSSILFISKSEHAVLVFEIIILFIIGLLPKTISDNFVNITISFVTSLQYCSFKKLTNYPYATTMCTGNLRSASEAAYIAFTKKDHESATKSIRYFIVIFSFLLGTFFGGLLTFFIGNKSIWSVDILLILSLVLLKISENRRNSTLGI
jgi:uncharacterized membrane protein YoaK (UPF0700 family)